MKTRKNSIPGWRNKKIRSEKTVLIRRNGWRSICTATSAMTATVSGPESFWRGKIWRNATGMAGICYGFSVIWWSRNA